MEAFRGCSWDEPLQTGKGEKRSRVAAPEALWRGFSREIAVETDVRDEIRQEEKLWSVPKTSTNATGREPSSLARRAAFSGRLSHPERSGTSRIHAPARPAFTLRRGSLRSFRMPQNLYSATSHSRPTRSSTVSLRAISLARPFSHQISAARPMDR